MTFKALGLAAFAIVVSAVPVFAHHSFAMFDSSVTATLDGTVKEFQWTNPYSWIMLAVADAEGQPVQWAIELAGPGGLARQGWKPETLTPGMNVKMVIHPLKDGTHGGQFMALTFPDGQQLGNPNNRRGREPDANP